eukprot:TCONS_00003971-protein
MRRSDRLKTKDQINYKTFCKVVKEQPPTSEVAIPHAMAAEIASLAIDYKIVHAELADFKDEHQVDPPASIKSLDKDFTSLEKLRNTLRDLFIRLEELSPIKEEFRNDFLQMKQGAKLLLAEIIKTLKVKREKETNQDTRLVKDISSSITSLKSSLENELSDKLPELSDAD